jgi:hypothetical protein
VKWFWSKALDVERWRVQPYASSGIQWNHDPTRTHHLQFWSALDQVEEVHEFP